MNLKEKLNLAITSASARGQDTLLEHSFVTQYGEINVMAELAITSNHVLEFQDVCVYPAISDSIPKGALDSVLRKQLREMLKCTAQLGYPHVKILGIRVTGSSSANPGRKVSISRKVKS